MDGKEDQWRRPTDDRKGQRVDRDNEEKKVGVLWLYETTSKVRAIPEHHDGQGRRKTENMTEKSFLAQESPKMDRMCRRGIVPFSSGQRGESNRRTKSPRSRSVKAQEKMIYDLRKSKSTIQGIYSS